MTADRRKRIAGSRRIRRGVLAAISGALALCVSAAVPANAQVFGVLTIDPEEGPVGSTVTGTVDSAAIAASCAPTSEELQAEGLAEFDQINAAFQEFINATWGGPGGRPDPATDAQSFAADLATGVLAGAIFDEAIGAQVWEQAHVLTFADIATQQPVGELSSFDPETGVGEITVPELAAGQWAVAATCLHWNTEVTVDDITEMMAIGTEFTEANLTTPFPELGSPEFIEIAQEVGPSMLGNIFLLPGELWVSLFAVTDGSGPGPGPGGPGTPPPAPPATPVPGDPDFTG